MFVMYINDWQKVDGLISKFVNDIKTGGFADSDDCQRTEVSYRNRQRNDKSSLIGVDVRCHQM